MWHLYCPLLVLLYYHLAAHKGPRGASNGCAQGILRSMRVSCRDWERQIRGGVWQDPGRQTNIDLGVHSKGFGAWWLGCLFPGSCSKPFSSCKAYLKLHVLQEAFLVFSSPCEPPPEAAHDSVLILYGPSHILWVEVLSVRVSVMHRTDLCAWGLINACGKSSGLGTREPGFKSHLCLLTPGGGPVGLRAEALRWA